jgi:N-methylhydantoinase A
VGGQRYTGAPLYRRDVLAVGQPVIGPALIEQDIATILVPPGFTARADGDGNLLLEKEI